MKYLIFLLFCFFGISFLFILSIFICIKTIDYFINYCIIYTCFLKHVLIYLNLLLLFLFGIYYFRNILIFKLFSGRSALKFDQLQDKNQNYIIYYTNRIYLFLFLFCIVLSTFYLFLLTSKGSIKNVTFEYKKEALVNLNYPDSLLYIIPYDSLKFINSDTLLYYVDFINQKMNLITKDDSNKLDTIKIIKSKLGRIKSDSLGKIFSDTTVFYEFVYSLNQSFTQKGIY